MAFLLFKWFLPFLVFTGFSYAEDAVATEQFSEKKLIHPFYVSVTEIAHNTKERSLEISFKIFADDMEDILKQNYKTPVDLNNEKQLVQNNKLINDYILKHFNISLDGKPAKMEFIGFEKDSESVYSYFEILNLPVVKKIDVNNSLLHDFKQEQINIMHVTLNGNRKSYKLDFPRKDASFVF